MVVSVIIPLFATFIGAFLAFRYQYAIEKRRDKRFVVQTLYMYRNVAANELEWIKAMNVIDIVFHDNERVRQLYDKYLDCVHDPEIFVTNKHVGIFYEMLYLMSQDCGYNQVTQHDIKRNVYSPNALDKHYPQSVEPITFHQGPLTKETAILLDEISQCGSA